MSVRYPIGRPVNLPLNEIKFLPREFSLRKKYLPEVIERYAKLLSLGPMDPIHVFLVGDELYCADGRYRILAHKKEAMTEILAVMHQGTLEEAYMFGGRINITHGRWVSDSEFYEKILQSRRKLPKMSRSAFTGKLMELGHPKYYIDRALTAMKVHDKVRWEDLRLDYEKLSIDVLCEIAKAHEQWWKVLAHVAIERKLNATEMADKIERMTTAGTKDEIVHILTK